MKAVLAKYVNLSGLQRLLTEVKSLGRKEDGDGSHIPRK